MATVGTGQRIDEREVDGFSSLAEQMVLRDQLVGGNLILQLGTQFLLAHNRVPSPFWGQRCASIISRIAVRIEFGNDSR